MLDTLLHTVRSLRGIPLTPPSAQRPACRLRGDDLLAASAQQLRRQRVLALRDWLGEDHELVLGIHSQSGARLIGAHLQGTQPQVTPRR